MSESRSKNEKQLVRFLDVIAAAGKPKAFSHNPAGFVRKFGRFYDPKQQPPREYAHGIPGLCYRNASKLAKKHREVVYVEGYALGVIPVAHAWCVDLITGAIIETTWRERGTLYYGVPFLTTFLLQAPEPPFVDDWERDFPVLRESNGGLRTVIMNGGRP